MAPTSFTITQPLQLDHTAQGAFLTIHHLSSSSWIALPKQIVSPPPHQGDISHDSLRLSHDCLQPRPGPVHRLHTAQISERGIPSCLQCRALSVLCHITHHTSTHFRHASSPPSESGPSPSRPSNSSTRIDIGSRGFAP